MKGKKEVIGIIDKKTVFNAEKPKYVPNFRCGKYMTEKDRPRKKVTKKNMENFL